MRLAKLRLPPGGPNAVLQTVKNYNRSVSENPTVIRDENDPLHIDWLREFERDYINVDDVSCITRNHFPHGRYRLHLVELHRKRTYLPTRLTSLNIPSVDARSTWQRTTRT